MYRLTSNATLYVLIPACVCCAGIHLGPTPLLSPSSTQVFLSTHEFYQVGSVFIFDASHIPAGCSVWPSFWTRGPDWPLGGEIDVLENVNLATANQMTLHTSAGCTQAATVTQLGKTQNTNCSLGVDSADGCTVVETQQDSFGDGFNSAGGGVWATQFDESGIL